jgi:omega-amidase
MKEELKVVLIQAPLVWENPKANRDYFSAKIKEINKETDLIVLPEMFTTGFTMNVKPLAESMDGVTINWLKEIAAENGVALTGSIIIKEHGNYYNRLLFITPEGELFYYDKKHLFTLANEQEHYSPGTKKLIVDYKGWKICPLICYDLRFPVWARNVENYDVLIYVANWPEVRTKAWDVLLQARAIENLAYCVGVNRVAQDGKGFNYIGHSAVYDAFGEIITAQNFESENVFQTTLSKVHLQEVRSKLKFLNDKDTFQLI